MCARRAAAWTTTSSFELVAEQRVADRRRHRDLVRVQVDVVAEDDAVLDARPGAPTSSSLTREPKPTRSGSDLPIGSIFDSSFARCVRWFSRACTNCCRSSADLYSAFSLRSPSSTAFWIAFGSVTVSSS
jgi:hypothetical protein